MKQALWCFGLVGVISITVAQRHIVIAHYSSVEQYNDSLLIYNTYLSQIEMLKSLKQTDYYKWFEREMHDDSLTACAFLRLKQLNKVEYAPIKTFEREGLGQARQFPAPSRINHAGVFVTSRYHYRYSITDKQTYFLCDSAGMTKAPYIIKYYYDRGRVLFIEKLNPITLEKIE